MRLGLGKHNLKRRLANLVGQVGCEPVQAQIMLAQIVFAQTMLSQIMLVCSCQVIHDEPTIGKTKNSAAMSYTEISVPVVLAFEAVRPSGTFACEHAAGRLGPIQPEKAPSAGHLILTINGNDVVNSAAGEGIVPRRGSVVEISSGIAGDVETSPPKVNVQLVSLKRTPGILARTDERPRLFVAETEIAGLGRRTWKRGRA